MEDATTLEHIDSVVEEGRSLRRRRGPGPQQRERIRRLDVNPHECWDLLRRHRALREFGEDPDYAGMRDEKTVEGRRPHETSPIIAGSVGILVIMFLDFPIRYLEDPKGLMGGPEEFSTITRGGLKEDLPDAVALLENVKLNEEQLLTLEVAIRQGGEGTPERGAQTWLEDNRSVVQPWVDAAKEAQQA